MEHFVSGVLYNQGAMPRMSIARAQSVIRSPRLLPVLIMLAAWFLPACAPQADSARFPEIAQESILVDSFVQITTSTPSPAATPAGESVQWVYALVAPFPTVVDGVTLDELYLAWSAGTRPSAFRESPLLMDETTRAALTALWDEPAAGAVQILPADRILDSAWSEMPSWAVVPSGTRARRSAACRPGRRSRTR